jgi:hypothetical protein
VTTTTAAGTAPLVVVVDDEAAEVVGPVDEVAPVVDGPTDVDAGAVVVDAVPPSSPHAVTTPTANTVASTTVHRHH